MQLSAVICTPACLNYYKSDNFCVQTFLLLNIQLCFKDLLKIYFTLVISGLYMFFVPERNSKIN